MRIAHRVTELVGHTPLVQLNPIPQSEEFLSLTFLRERLWVR
jgi:hypothetical protein